MGCKVSRIEKANNSPIGKNHVPMYVTRKVLHRLVLYQEYAIIVHTTVITDKMPLSYE